jgi:hypothetical protein
VTGRDWRDYVHDEILAPLGMTTAALRWSPAVDARLARGYDDGPAPLPYYAIYHHPAGNLMASPRELAALLRLELGRGRIDGRAVVSPAGMARIERSETNAIRGLDSDYGLGNYGSAWRGQRMRGHDGGIDGFISACHYLPDHDAGFVMLFNSTGRAVLPATREVSQLLVEFLVDKAVPPPPRARVDRDQLEAVTGDYAIANPRHQLFAFIERLQRTFRVRLDGTRLLLSEQPTQRFEVELVPLGGGRFRFPASAGSHVAAARDEDGRRVLFVDGLYLVAEPSWVGPLYYYGTRVILWLLFSTLALPLAALLMWRRGVAIGSGWPLAALASLIAVPVLFSRAASARSLGECNVCTVGICVFTIVFAVSAVGALYQAIARLSQPLALLVKLHRLAIALAAATATLYLAAHHIIGIRLWSY